MKQLLLILSLCLSASVLLASHPSATGVVVDAETNEVLPFTTISIGGKGTVANAEGIFALNLDGLAAKDSVYFSHVGYETLALAVGQVKDNMKVRMKPAIVNLSEVAVYSKDLTARDIIELIRENYSKNYPKASAFRKVFLHNYEKAKFPNRNQIIMKESDFAGLDKDIFNELLDKLPDEFVEYQDVLMELYRHDEQRKLVPIEGISLQESSMEDLTKEFEEKLSVFMKDIEQTNKTEDVYYKFRTGIFAFDADMEADSSDTSPDEKSSDFDSLHYTLGIGHFQGVVDFLESEYADIESDNWEFINKPAKYKYSLDELTILNDELVHKLTFTPKRGGLFEGVMYVSASTYAILQLDFAFAPDKSTENIQLLGIGHSMKYKRGRVIYERGTDGYYLKYIYARQHETASIERSFSFMKKEKRFLWDKTLNELKIETNMFFDISTYQELLVLERAPIDQAQFEQIQEPDEMKLKKEYAYSPEMWENTVIAPTAELQKYKRKQD